jgi:hypothetical protein
MLGNENSDNEHRLVMLTDAETAKVTFAFHDAKGRRGFVFLRVSNEDARAWLAEMLRRVEAEIETSP